MASPLVARSPQCLSCLRQITGSLRETFSLAGNHQIRGKKKLAKTPSRVTIKLLKHVPKYGRMGTILQIPPGLMRNDFYPRKVAEYVTAAQLHEMGEDRIVERDRSFNQSGVGELEIEMKARALLKKQSAKALVAAEKALRESEEPAPAVLDMLSPEKSTDILSNLLPPFIEFFRPLIAVPEAAPKRISPSIPTTSVVSSAASQGKPTVAPKLTTNGSIYGSVSTADIAANMKAILGEHPEGARIVLSSEEISFVKKVEDNDRVKKVGVYEIEIKLKGSTDVVRRSIKVSAEA
ncbi:hypothetical protein BP5796_00256 [Coleophoma crateriformis]|uniref:Ribosomal protein L9 domain-containing protein n=1 Tax=Coleophoma crateriformis TaxID=565419 RepID=A0A3D8T7F1_9HELO|nr:hypothetical protein BP5796_00256 [Coleophoma crateriformis]